MREETPPGLVIRAAALYDLASGNPSASRTESEQLVEEARAVGDAEALVAALRALAQSYRALLAHDRAEPLLDEAVRLAGRHGLDARLGEVLATRGALRHEQGRPRAAQRDLERASTLLAGRDQAEVVLQRAALAHNAGRLSEAAGLYAGLLRRPGLGADIRTRAANNLGLTEATLGRHRSASYWLEQSAAAAAEVGPAYVALVAESRAWAAVRAGRLTEGVARFDEAVSLWQRADLPLGELYSEYADALSDLRLLPEAREQAERAASMLDGQNVPLMAAEARLRLARLALAMGQTRTAEQVAEEAAHLLRRQRRPDWAARACLIGVQARLDAGTAEHADHGIARRAASTLHSSGAVADAAEAYLAAGRVAAATGRRAALALQDYRRAAELSPRSPVLARLRGYVAQALAAQVRHDDVGLLSASRTGLRDLSRHRAALPSTELRALASGHGAELATLGLGALVRGGSPAQVLSWMERTRVNALSVTDPLEVDGLEEEMASLRAVQAEIAGARQDGNARSRALMAQQADLEARIRRRTWAATRGRGEERPSGGELSPVALRRALEGRVLVEYDVLDEALLAAVVEHGRTRLVPLGGLAAVESEIESLRLTLHVLAVAVDRMAPALHDVARAVVDRLTALLVTPLGISDGCRLVVVPVGPLQRVPWSAVHTGPVAVAPSAKLWMRSREAAEPAGSVVLAAGPDLDGAVVEARTLAARYPGSLVLVPPQSRVRTVRAALDGASLAHLACHGHVRADNPTFSSLQLSDGMLAVHEFDQGAGSPHRLVLAACDVGGSVTYPGNEVLGFVGTLLARGTSGLVASSTVVPDTHVTPLMVSLHDGIAAGLTLADALYAARTEIGSDDPRTYPAWCTFTAYGAA